jgi:hypothetical protein
MNFDQRLWHLWAPQHLFEWHLPWRHLPNFILSDVIGHKVDICLRHSLQWHILTAICYDDIFPNHIWHNVNCPNALCREGICTWHLQNDFVLLSLCLSNAICCTGICSSDIFPNDIYLNDIYPYDICSNDICPDDIYLNDLCHDDQCSNDIWWHLV